MPTRMSRLASRWREIGDSIKLARLVRWLSVGESSRGMGAACCANNPRLFRFVSRQDFARRDLNGERNLPAPRRMGVECCSLLTRARATIRRHERHRKRPGSHPGLLCSKTVAGSVVKGNPFDYSTQTLPN